MKKVGVSKSSSSVLFILTSTPFSPSSSASSSSSSCTPHLPLRSHSRVYPARRILHSPAYGCFFRRNYPQMNFHQLARARVRSEFRVLFLALCVLVLQCADAHKVSRRHINDSAGAVARPLAMFKDASVRQMTTFADVLALALDNSTVIVYSIGAAGGEPLLKERQRWNAAQPTPTVSAVLEPGAPQPMNAAELLEFKLTDKDTLLLCDYKFCQACKINGICNFYSLRGTENLASVSGSLVSENLLVLRTVSRDESGSIYFIEPGNSNPKHGDDKSSITNITVIFSFSTEKHTYFVGSANRVDLPNSYTHTKRKYRDDIRVSRVCNRDGTPSLESRIDVALSCDSLDEGVLYTATAPNRVKAASLSPDGRRLLIAVENGTSSRGPTSGRAAANRATNEVVCEFDVTELKRRFDDTWDICQTIEDTTMAQNDCSDADVSKNLSCFLFSWKKEARIPLCERFNKRATTARRPLDNCRLDESKIGAHRYGHLENFLPIMGKVIARPLNNSKQIVGVFESSTRDALFITRANGIERLRKSIKSELAVWSMPLPPMEFMAAVVDGSTNSLLFTAEKRLNYIHLTCEALYPTCELISWQDPLQCGWCADEKGGGHTFSFLHPESCPLPDQLLDSCPPKITEVAYEKGRYIIFGEGFDKVDDLHLTACEEECRIEHKISTLIRCSASQMCAVLLNGAVGGLPDFRLVYEEHLKEPAIDSGAYAQNGLFKNHSRLVRILVTIFVVFLLFTILVIVWQLYRKYADRIRVKVRQNAEKNPKGKYMSVSTDFLPPSSSSFNGNDGENAASFPLHPHYHYHHHNRNQHAPHHSSSNNPNSVSKFGGDFASTANFVGGAFGAIGGEIDKSRIYIIKHIGDGNSSKVHLAKYVHGADAEASRRVAVKTVFNANFDVEDIMREIELISKCRHKNIVEYIGHYEDDFGRMHIVTEYMAGGDLHEFLISENSKVTVGDAFLFILQICEGMEYLTKQHIIHRDLAARNCMLDDEHVVVKITDFGLCRTSNIDYEYISENAGQQLPFRWTAIECFGTNRKFSEKSDVWSFGVVVWEIFARDVMPYEGKDSNGVRDFLKSGKRLEFERIPACPYEIYERIMLYCWDELPQNRPSFTQLRVEIERIYWGLENASPEYLKTEYETPISTIGSPTPTTISTTPMISPISTPM